MDGEYVRNELLTSQWSGMSPGSIFYTGGNVGIGTIPGYTLDVATTSRGMNVYSTTTTEPLIKILTSGNHASSIFWSEDRDGSTPGPSYGGSIFTWDHSSGSGLFNLVAGAYNESNTYKYGSTRGASRIVMNDASLTLLISSLASLGGQTTGTVVTWYNSITMDNNNVIFYTTNGTERVRVDSSGNVGIGTTVTPKILTVKGDASINDIIVGRGGSSAVDSSNTALGKNAMLNRTSGSSCVAIGDGSQVQATSGSFNTAVGAQTLFYNAGNNNTAVGYQAMNNLIAGSNNTAVGAEALVQIPQTFTNCTGLGYQARTTGDNQVQCGNSSTSFYAYGTYNNRSDMRDKADIRDTIIGLEFINKLRPVDFRWNYREDYQPTETNDGSKKRVRFHQGVIAQQVKEVMDELGVDFSGYQDHSINGGSDVLTIGYTAFIGPLIKAIQELSAKNNALEQRLSVLEA